MRHFAWRASARLRAGRSPPWGHLGAGGAGSGDSWGRAARWGGAWTVGITTPPCVGESPALRASPAAARVRCSRAGERSRRLPVRGRTQAGRRSLARGQGVPKHRVVRKDPASIPRCVKKENRYFLLTESRDAGRLDLVVAPGVDSPGGAEVVAPAPNRIFTRWGRGPRFARPTPSGPPFADPVPPLAEHSRRRAPGSRARRRHR